MNKLAVIGPGLLGGSIALAARQLPDWTTSVWARRPEAVQELLALGCAARASTDLREIAEDADLAILCVPIGAMPPLAQQLARIVPAHAIVTDVGSVKDPVVKALAPLFKERGLFLGSHPMAGSHDTGLSAARAHLFQGTVCILTPHEGVPEEAISAVGSFWEAIGCSVKRLSPPEHDEIVALISHTPHLLAAALVNAVGDRSEPADDFAGPGFRDTTRVASGPPEMWTEILKSNRAAVRNSAEAVIEKLREFITLLDRDSPAADHLMNQFLAQAKARRDRLRPIIST